MQYGACGKVSYPNAVAAWASAGCHRMGRKGGAYRCKICPGGVWHITRISAGRRVGRKWRAGR